MKLLSEYLFAAMFFLASGLSFSIGSAGAGIVCGLLGVYFPLRELINELDVTIRNWTSFPRKMKIIWMAFALISCAGLFQLVYLDLAGLFGILGIAFIVYINASQKKT
tara:strand:+ start:789 stop:1112 length:324 start_codon:yes stop_codon:yes gene_type:complete